MIADVAPLPPFPPVNGGVLFLLPPASGGVGGECCE